MITYDVPSLIESDAKSNITDLLVERAKNTPELAIFARPNQIGVWVDSSYSDFYNEVCAVAKGIIASGVQPGQAVAIMSHTSYEWVLLDFALWFAGAVSVPIYETSSPAQMAWILSDSDSVAIFYEDKEMKSKVATIRAGLPFLRQEFNITGGAIEELKKQGIKVSDELLEERRTSAKLNDLATIIYTSGTTGRPKGCELLHRGFVDLSKNAKLELPEVIADGQKTLLFLPMAHVFARFISVLCVHAGVKVGHQADVKNLAGAMQSFKPNFLLAVPRVFEKVYNSAEQKAEAGGKGDIFRRAADVAVAYSEAIDAGHVPVGLRIKFALFNKLVFGKIRDAMGGQVRYAVSGGAPLGPRLGHFYKAIGLTVLEGYGMTETTAPAMIGRANNLKIGKVGILLPGCGIKISDDGEIWLRGSNVMRGYWRNPSATAESFEGEWLKTGDIGSLDEDGFLSITGRKKELLITAGGKNVAPAPIEDPLRADPLIGQAVVIGDNKPFIACLFSLDAEMLPLWLANHDLDEKMTLAEAARHPVVIQAIQAAVDKVNLTLSKAESIRKFVILDQELTEASGHLTPSLKIKRGQVMQDFAAQVSDIYSGVND
ncbi:MAG: AMP-dependent synthetase/ligase [Micrococcales bacterium]